MSAMELRCPECLSPEVEPRPDSGAAMRCGNCGGLFDRSGAYVTVEDAESALPDSDPAPLFNVDLGRARAELLDPHGRLWTLEPAADADELNRLVDAAQEAGVIVARREPACVYIYPLSVDEPDPLLAVFPGRGPTILGHEQKLRPEDGEDPREFTVRVIATIAEEANSLASGPAADGGRLDRIAAFLNQPGQWNGGDVCQFVAEEIVASGRRLRDADE